MFKGKSFFFLIQIVITLVVLCSCKRETQKSSKIIKDIVTEIKEDKKVKTKEIVHKPKAKIKKIRLVKKDEPKKNILGLKSVKMAILLKQVEEDIANREKAIKKRAKRNIQKKKMLVIAKKREEERKIQKQKELERRKKEENINNISSRLNKKITTITKKTNDTSESDEALLQAYLDEEIELEPDYELVESSVAGLDYNYDKRKRAQLYGANNNKVLASNQVKEIKKQVVKEDLELTVPDENKTVEYISSNKDFVYGYDPPVEEENINSTLAKGPILQVNEKEFQKQVFEETQRSSKIIPLPIINEKETIIESGIVKKDLTETNLLAPPLLNPAKAEAKKIDMKKLLASKDEEFLPVAKKLPKETKLELKHKNAFEGKIKLDPENEKFSKGYVKIAFYDKVGKDGYPDEYSNVLFEEALLPGQKEFNLKNYAKGEKSYPVAHFYPATKGKFVDPNDKQFIALPEKDASGSWVMAFKDNKKVQQSNNKIVHFKKKEEVKTEEEKKEQKTSSPILNAASALVSNQQMSVVSRNDEIETDNSKESNREKLLEDIEVRIKGTNLVAPAGEQGVFPKPLFPKETPLHFEVYGKEIYPTIFSSCQLNNNEIPLFTEDEVNKIFEVLKTLKIEQNAKRGLIIGKLESNETVENIYVDIFEKDADGPFYFNDNGELDINMETTGKNGLFLYANVPEGLQLIGPFGGTINDRQELPGTAVDVFAETIAYTRINIDDRVNLKIRVLNAIASEKNEVSNAKIVLIGAPQEKEMLTNKEGEIVLKNIKAGHGINTIEVMKEGFVTTRVTKCLNNDSLDIFIFPESFIENLIHDNNLHYDPRKGIVMGSLPHGGRLTVDVEDADRAQILYFDAYGKIDLDRNATEPIHSNFMILNIPSGQRTVSAYDSKGNIKKHFTIRSSGSIVSSVVSN